MERRHLWINPLTTVDHLEVSIGICKSDPQLIGKSEQNPETNSIGQGKQLCWLSKHW
jgi:hypothetical protein